MPARQLHQPGWEVRPGSNREGNTSGKAGIDLNQAYCAAFHLALNIRRTDDLQSLGNIFGEGNDVVVFPRDSFIADAGANDETFAWNDRQDTAVKIRENIHGKFRAGKLILDDCIRNIVRETIEAAPRSARRKH